MQGTSAAARAELAESHARWRAAHAGLFLVLFLLGLRIPALARWPLYLLGPLAACLTLSAFVAPLRNTLSWLRLGRCDRSVVILTAAISVATSAVLLLFQAIAQPDVSGLAAQLQMTMLGSVWLAGACFSLLNSLLEEVAFRGLLYDGLEARWGWAAAVVASSLLFGAGHVNGYPPGVPGGVLAGVYGLVLGWLRHRTGGLAAVTAAHVLADVTIFGILVRCGCAGVS